LFFAVFSQTRAIIFYSWGSGLTLNFLNSILNYKYNNKFHEIFKPNKVCRKIVYTKEVNLSRRKANELMSVCAGCCGWQIAKCRVDGWMNVTVNFFLTKPKSYFARNMAYTFIQLLHCASHQHNIYRNSEGRRFINAAKRVKLHSLLQ
jgi:hypothetical protein